MKNIFQQTAFFSIVMLSLAWSEPSDEMISSGSQPQLSVDNKGVVRLVFGRADSIFCSTSVNEGVNFSKPVFVGHITSMHLGMSRGPQIASSNKYSLITAIDKSGNIHYFKLTHSSGKWAYKGLLNDIKSSAPEGLMSIASDAKDKFYAVWLDIRQGNKNNICFSALSGTEEKWGGNALIYISPDEHVCECCKPSIAVKGSKVAIMYRNWLNGSRDLYVKASENGGGTFKEAQKLGIGTWKLNGCPMDGGGIAIDNTGHITTTWQREGIVYYCKLNESETTLLKGRACSITLNKTNNNKTFITMQDGGNVKIMDLGDKKEFVVGKGSFLKSLMLPDENIICTWEQDNNIKFKKITIQAMNSVFVN